MPRLLTPAEAAALLEMNPRTLIAWARKNYVPAHGLGEGKRRLWRFLESELVEWVAQQGTGKKLYGR